MWLHRSALCLCLPWPPSLCASVPSSLSLTRTPAIALGPLCLEILHFITSAKTLLWALRVGCGPVFVKERSPVIPPSLLGQKLKIPKSKYSNSKSHYLHGLGAKACPRPVQRQTSRCWHPPRLPLSRGRGGGRRAWAESNSSSLWDSVFQSVSLHPISSPQDRQWEEPATGEVALPSAFYYFYQLG